MEAHEIDVLKNLLLSLREEIGQLTAQSSDATSTVALDQSKVGRLSRMDAMQAQQMAQETARRRQLQLQKIDSALKRIALDDYGYCYKCGDEIEAARLKFDPAYTRCVQCTEA